MSKLKLSGSHLPHIYHETVYRLGDNKPLDEADMGTDEEGLDLQNATYGKNLKKIAILVSYPEKEVIDDSDLTFLEKILAAVKLTSEHVVIINLSKLPDNYNYDQIQHDWSPQCLIAFGVTFFDINIKEETFNLYELKEYNSCRFLNGDALKTIAQNQDKKKALWVNLQRMFL